MIAEKCPISSIDRINKLTQFDFVQQSMASGTSFRLGNTGHFIVASEQSLLPRFVVELKLPVVSSLSDYQNIVAVLNEHSSGFLWYDSNSFDAYDLVWRLRLPVRASSPLFIAETSEVESQSGSQFLGSTSFKIRQISAKHEDKFYTESDLAKKMLTQLPSWAGGQQMESVSVHIEKRNVLLLEYNGESIGAATFASLGNGQATIVAGDIHPEYKNRDSVVHFLNLIRHQLIGFGVKTVSLSMNNQDLSTYQMAIDAGYKPLVQSYIAQLGTVG